MELLIRKWGNDAAVRLPLSILAQLGVLLGDSLVVDVQPDGIMLRRARKIYTLAELMAQCDLKTGQAADMTEWSVSPPVGREVL